jgi:hypothetical protein
LRLTAFASAMFLVRARPAIIKKEDATCGLRFGSKRVLTNMGSLIVSLGNALMNLMANISVYYLIEGMLPSDVHLHNLALTSDMMSLFDYYSLNFLNSGVYSYGSSNCRQTNMNYQSLTFILCFSV